jgi:type VI secretion system protein VasG
VKVGLASKPAELEDLERAVQALEREIGGIERDLHDGNEVDAERLDGLRSRIEDRRAEAEKVRVEWLSQKKAAEALISARDRYLATQTDGPPAPAPAAGGAPQDPSAPAPAADGALRVPSAPAPAADGAPQGPPDGAPADEESLKKALDEAKAAFAEACGDAPLLYVEVTEDTVAKVVSDWTGIPVGRIAAEQAELVSDLENRLRQRIRGQDDALRAVARVIQASKAGLRDPSCPMGVFLLAGPSGVGKTETGLALASLLFGDEKSVVTINMSEFQEKFTVTRLIGSPPGYVGYGEGGVLTEAVRQRPYSVVLLDEAEKAHLDVMNLFYQVFDKGVLSDGEGKAISFRNTLILLTSNLATETIAEATQADPPATWEELSEAVRPELSRHFRPALLARMTVVPYRSLGRDALADIARIKLDALKGRVRSANGLELRYGDDLVDTIVGRCRDDETGARNIDTVLASVVMPPMAREILNLMSSGAKDSRVLSIGVDAQGGFTLDFS